MRGEPQAIRQAFTAGFFLAAVFINSGCSQQQATIPSGNDAGKGAQSQGQETKVDRDFKQALQFYKKQELDKAEAAFIANAKLAKAEEGEGSQAYLRALEHLCWVYQEKARYSEARKILTKINQWSPEQQAKFKSVQLIAYAHTSKYEDAAELTLEQKRDGIKFCRAGLALLQPALGHGDPGLLKLYGILNKIYLSDQDYSDSDECLVQIRNIRESTTGTDSVAYAEACVDLGNLYVKWAKQLIEKDDGFANPAQLLADARENFASAEKAYSAALGSDSPKVAAIKESQKMCEELVPKAQALAGGKSQESLTSTGELPPFKP